MSPTLQVKQKKLKMLTFLLKAPSELLIEINYKEVFKFILRYALGVME